MDNWNADRLAKLKRWIDEQARLIGHEIASRADGEPSGTFDDDGNPGKFVTKEEADRCEALFKERLEARIQQIGLIVTDLQSEYYRPVVRVPGHMRRRISFNIADDAPVPFQFR
jgi:hypothetical protein